MIQHLKQIIEREVFITKNHFRDLSQIFKDEGLQKAIKYDLRACNSYRNDLYPKIAGVGLLAFYVGCIAKIGSCMIKGVYTPQENYVLAERLESQIAGEDKIISNQEMRDFLDNIGYMGAISENSYLKITAQPQEINIFILSERKIIWIPVEQLKNGINK